jgi:hypothetical protein
MLPVKDAPVKWYLAKMVFRIIVGDGSHTPQFEEQFRLLPAEDALDAFHLARKTGDAEQVIRRLTITAGVEWEFIDVTELYLLDSRITGTGIFSRQYEVQDVLTHKKEVRRKAGYLINHCTEQFIDSI